jgi:hypothetical protein
LGGEGDGDSSVGGAGGEASSLPGGAVEVGFDAAVGGGDVDVATEVVDAEAAVGGFTVDGVVDGGERETAVHGVEGGGKTMGDEEFVAHGPVTGAGGVRAVGFDRSAGLDGDLVEEGGGFGLAAGAGGDAGFEGDILAVFADDFDAAVLAVDVEVPADEREGGGAEFAGLLGATEEAGDGAAIVAAVVAGVGGEVLGVERGGGE